jgi:hypothetical protein
MNDDEVRRADQGPASERSTGQGPEAVQSTEPVRPAGSVGERATAHGQSDLRGPDAGRADLAERSGEGRRAEPRSGRASDSSSDGRPILGGVGGSVTCLMSAGDGQVRARLRYASRRQPRANTPRVAAYGDR